MKYVRSSRKKHKHIIEKQRLDIFVIFKNCKYFLIYVFFNIKSSFVSKMCSVLMEKHNIMEENFFNCLNCEIILNLCLKKNYKIKFYFKNM